MRDQATGLPLLLLPKGLEYISYGWTGDPMANGAPTPSAHDGMAAFRRGRTVHLVRNHERGNGTPFADPASVYDPTAADGTTNLVFDPHGGEWLESYPSLSGTIRNCCGGPDYRSSEWAGATFEPGRGNWLFANLQTPGITFAITGPWQKGAL